jgi:hypothetical protein
MYPYQSTQYNTFMALVQASNPGLNIAPLSQAQLRALVPTTVTADSFGRDTSVRLMVRPGNSSYYGSQAVTYRRINVTNYFRNLNVTLSDYLTGTGNMTGAQLAVALNNKYGTSFDTGGADFPSSLSAVSGTKYTQALQSTSICYEGSLTFTWTRGKQFISALVTNPVLVGRQYPTSNVEPPAKPQGDFLTYNLDNSSIKTSIAAITSGSTVTAAQLGTAGSIYASVLSYLQKARPDLNLTAADSGTTGGLGNLVWTRYTLPSASLPGANSNKFTACMVITAVAGSWFQGSLYLHYNA